MRVINLFGGPGAGKSTTAAGLFYLMKSEGMKVELVTEYAKDLTYEGADARFRNQLYILAKQDQRLRRLEGQVDYVVTDSPLLLSLAYAKPPWTAPWFEAAVLGTVETYKNFNVEVLRVKPYQTYGRSQTEREARSLDTTITNILTFRSNSPHVRVHGNHGAPALILERLRELH